VFLCQYHVGFVAMALQCSLKSGILIAPALFFYLMIALAVWDLLYFHSYFMKFFSVSVKDVIEILMEIAFSV
jgi:hypothetical protein